MASTTGWSAFAPAIAEIWLAFAVCAILLTGAFAGEKRRGLVPALTLIALAIGCCSMDSTSPTSWPTP
jgi:hypothetical protein